MTEVLYPHEWLWRKMHEHRSLIVAVLVAIITTLLAGYIVILIAVGLAEPIDAVQLRSAPVYQLSPASYIVPILACIGIVILLFLAQHLPKEGG